MGNVNQNTSNTTIIHGLIPGRSAHSTDDDGRGVSQASGPNANWAMEHQQTQSTSTISGKYEHFKQGHENLQNREETLHERPCWQHELNSRIANDQNDSDVGVCDSACMHMPATGVGAVAGPSTKGKGRDSGSSQ